MPFQPLPQRDLTPSKVHREVSISSESETRAPLLRHLSASYRPIILLTLLCLALYLPGIASLPPTDRDEARYLQATRQMMETGDYVRIRFQHTEREKKPVGVHWLQALVARPLGGEAAPVWAYRIPSLVGALTAVLLTFWIGVRLLSREAAFCGAVALGSTLVLVAEAHLAKTDAILLAMTVATIGPLVSAFAAAPLRRAEAIVLWAALAVGTLVKGPVLPGLTATTTIALALLFPTSRTSALRSLRPVMGIPLAASIIGPWVIAITIATGGGFFSRAFVGDIAPKLVGVHESHGGFPGYYAALLLLTFWPWSLIVAPAIAAAWRARHDRAMRALAAWIVPAWFVIELVPTKLPHYSLPLFPPLALLVGHWLTTAPSWQSAQKGVVGILTKGWMVATSALAVLFIGAALAFGPLCLLVAIPLAITLSLVIRHILRLKDSPALAVARPLLLSAVITFPLFFGLLFPHLRSFWLSRSLHQELAMWPVERASAIAIAGYKEPSAVFLLGTDVVLTDGAGAAAAIREGSATVAVVEQRELDSFTQSLGTCHRTLERGTSINGFNYSKGKYMTLHLFRKNAPCTTDVRGEPPAVPSVE